MKTVIIGGVAGGASAAARLRRLDESAEIVMLEKGGYISFANCGLPYYVGGGIEDREELSIQTPESFRARFNVDVRPLNEATGIDTSKKTVMVRDLEKGGEYTESYDTLILAPGASPIVPGMIPADSRRIFTVRTIPDAERIKDYVISASPKTAVIAGGGFIGLEMAENLITLGLKVIVVGRAPQVLPNVDIDVAWDVHRYLREKGLKLETGTAMTAVSEANGSLTITTNKGSIMADMLVVATGVKPDSGIAAAAGIACDSKGYIIVDDAMRTSAQDVYAVGDAVEIKEFISGERTHVALAGPANRQARIAADQICGIDTRYKGSQRSFIIKLFDKTVAATGMTEKYAGSLGIDSEKVHLYQSNHAGYYPGGEMMCVKVLFEKKTGKILGGQFFGGEGVDKRADVLAAAIRAGMNARDITELELC